MTTFKRTGKGDGPKEFQIKSIGLPVEERTEKKLPSISEDTLRSLAGDMEEDAPGKAFERLGTEGEFTAQRNKFPTCFISSVVYRIVFMGACSCVILHLSA